MKFAKKLFQNQNILFQEAKALFKKRKK